MTTFTTEDRQYFLNAYKLADLLDFKNNQSIDWRALDDASKVLRMQADEIKALRKQLNELL